MTDSDPIEQQLRKELLELCHKFEDKEFMAVHGKCDMELAAPRCAKRVHALEKLADTYAARRADEARLEEANYILNGWGHYENGSGTALADPDSLPLHIAELNHKDSL